MIKNVDAIFTSHLNESQVSFTRKIKLEYP